MGEQQRTVALIGPGRAGTTIALGLIVLYTYRAELRSVSERVMAELTPGRAVSRGVHIVEIVRGRNGDFQVAAQINGVRIALILDTGASSVVLTQEAAKAVGLPLEVLVYDINVDTANGRTRAASRRTAVSPRAYSERRLSPDRRRTAPS